MEHWFFSLLGAERSQILLVILVKGPSLSNRYMRTLKLTLKDMLIFYRIFTM